jgi:acyl carrier protein
VKNRFLESAAVVLETQDIGFDTDFRSLPGWCSLQGFGLLVMMENEWSAPVALDAFMEMKTLRDLFAEALLALAAEVFGVGRRDLSLSAGRGSVDAWDSVNHLRLVMEAEKRFGVVYRMQDIPELETLSDFVGKAGESEEQ